MFLLKHSDRQPHPHTSHYTVQHKHIYSKVTRARWRTELGAQSCSTPWSWRASSCWWWPWCTARTSTRWAVIGWHEVTWPDAHLWLVQVLSDDIQQAQVDFQVYREKAEVCFKQLEAKNNDINAKWVWVEVILIYFQDMMMTSSFLHSYKHKYLKVIRFIVPVSNISRYLIDF